MLHYIAVLVPQIEGGWRVHFPDFPGCRAEGAYLEQAIGVARQAVYQQVDMSAADGAVPFPSSLDAIVADPDWAGARGVDWRRSVISLVPFTDIATAVVSTQHSSGVQTPKSAA
jgi:predicted RNase H-like HicB family nuclease